MNWLEGLTLPLKFQHGVIKDASGQTVINANRETGTTPLFPAGRDALLALTCELLNRSFEHDEATTILKKLGY